MLAGVLLVTAAHASPMDFYGFGARRMGRAASGLALPDGFDAVLTDPAALPGIPYPELGVGFVLAQSDFYDLPPVYWDTNQDGYVTDADTPLELDPDADPVHGFLIGATRPFGRRAAGGVALFVPVERLFRLQTFEPSLPTYFLYGNRTQRYELGGGLAWRPIGGLAIGGGLQMIPRARYRLDATLDVTVAGTDDPDATAGDVLGLALDVHTMELDVVAGFSPSLSLHWDAGQAVPALQGLQLAGAWRGAAGLPVDVAINLQANLATEDLGDLDDIVVPLLLALDVGVFDHYVPATLTIGGAYTFRETVTVTADLKRTSWDQMRLSIARVVHASIDGAAVDLGDEPIDDGNPYEVVLRATWSPRLGTEITTPAVSSGTRLGEVRLLARGGVGFEPSPLVSQTVTTALLDSSRVIFAFGGGVRCDDPLRTKERRAMEVDGFFQYHQLAAGQLDRGTPAEPTAGYAVDGSAYPVGGHLLAAGVEWSLQY